MDLHFTHQPARRTLHSRLRTLPPVQPAPAPCILPTPFYFRGCCIVLADWRSISISPLTYYIDDGYVAR
jgi:hypothetical protein